MTSFWSKIPKPKLKLILEKLYLLPPAGAGMTYTQIAEKLSLTPQGVRRLLMYCEVELRGKRTDHLPSRTSRLHNVPSSDWIKLGVAGVAKKYTISYNRARQFYQKYKEVIK